jgi:peptidoglycan-associated lipoprotein
MKKQAVYSLLVLSCAVLVSSGCAKHELVKKDEPLASAATAATRPTVTPDAAEPSIRTESVKEQPVKKDTGSGQELKPIQNAGELKAALEKVYFDFDSFTLSREARDALEKNASILKNEKAAMVQIEGNCDERGSDEYNLALGEKRARSAMRYLAAMGVPADRLSVISYGREKPADPGHDEAAWAKNRRDEFVVITK